MTTAPPHISPSPTVPLSVRLRRTCSLAALFAVVGALLYARSFSCVFAWIFHVPCPGCGSTRAVLALLHGDLHGVLAYNFLGPVAAGLIALLALDVLRSVFVHGDARAAGQGRLGGAIKLGVFVVAGLEVVVWVARFFGFFGGPVPV
jgi:hypothetical protein